MMVLGVRGAGVRPGVRQRVRRAVVRRAVGAGAWGLGVRVRGRVERRDLVQQPPLRKAEVGEGVR